MVPHVVDELEGAVLHRWWSDKASLIESSQLPTLYVFSPPWEVLEVIVDPLVLEEEGLVAPEGSHYFTCHDYAPN